MSNPVITENAAGSNYSVSDSVRVHADLALSMFSGEANFDVSFPDTAAPTVTLLQGATSLALTVPAAIEQMNNVTFPNRVVRWQTTDLGGTRTLHVRVEDTLLIAVGEAWTIKAAALPAAVTTGVVAGSNAVITLVEADPIIEVLTPALNRLENQSANLQARTRRNTLPLPAGPGCAGVVMTWSQTPGDVVTAMPGATGSIATVFPGMIPGCQGEATVNIPPLTASVTLHYTFSVTIGEFSNTGVATINASTRIRHSALVLDRSGSMMGAKWDNAVKAAHIWLDLLIAFRSGVSADDRVGIVVFEDGNCTGFRAIGAPDPDVRIEFPAPGGAPGAYPALPAPASLNLGSPGDCTPIGDGLIKGLDSMIGLPGVAADNFYSVLLMTDGLENAGTVRVDKEAPPPLVAGVEIFETIRSAGARSIFDFTDPGKNTRLYTVGVGPDGGVSTDVLDDLAYGDVATAPGYYRLVSNLADMVPAFGEMLTHNIGAMRSTAAAAPALADPGAPAAGTAAYFLAPQGATKLVVVLLWNAIADQMELMWRHQGVPGEAFVAVPGAAINIHARASHGLAVIDMTSGGLNSTGTEWRAQYKPGGGAVAAINPNNVLAARNPHVRTEIVFDRTSYQTGQPMRIEARIGAGGQPVTNAQAVVELAAPGESLGTFLAVNSQQFQITTIPSPTVTIPPSSVTAVGAAQMGDPARPKQVLLSHLLRLKQMEELPVLIPSGFFVDGTNKLWDDGAHGDGAANDGRYANTYAKTDKEGTYTFRFNISGQTPDGSRFADTITMSRWVGVNVDPFSSLVVVNYNLSSPNDRFQVARILVTPKDRGGQFLGPFRASEIKFTATNGTFRGEMVIHPDGRYSRELVYPRGKVPIVTVSVQGKSFAPVAVAQGCLGRFALWLRSLIEWFLRLFRS